MSSRDPANVTGEVIRWARERTGMSHAKLAEKLPPGVTVEKLRAWEGDIDAPTFAQAKKLAQVLNIPFGYLFLSSPPDEKLPLPDLRAGTAAERKPSAEFLDLLSDVLNKQSWYRRYLLEEEARPLPFVGKFNSTDDASDIAADIRNTVGLNNGVRSQAVGYEDFLRKFIRATEARGVLVMRSGIVGSNTHRSLSVEEFRGFVITDDLAPFIFINGRDFKAAQVFTLAHELAHIWIGKSGVSNPNLELRSTEQGHGVERFCNQIAAEILTPRDEFLAEWHDDLSIPMNLRHLSKWFRVSTMVVLRDAFDFGKISSGDYSMYFQRELRRVASRETPGDDSRTGNFYSTLWSRNSPSLVSALVSGAFDGTVLFRDAARLLNVRVATLHSIAEKLGEP